jgi:hypothetical protein
MPRAHDASRGGGRGVDAVGADRVDADDAAALKGRDPGGVEAVAAERFGQDRVRRRELVT